MNYGFVSPHNFERVQRGILVDINNVVMHTELPGTIYKMVWTSDYARDCEIVADYLQTLRSLYNTRF